MKGSQMALGFKIYRNIFTDGVHISNHWLLVQA